MIGVFAYFSRELPNPNQLLERSFELATKYFDRDGNLIFEQFGDKNRTLVKLDEISPYVIQATLATEDSEFYKHQGYSLRGMTRAVRNMLVGGDPQSGSTLTQQVIKVTLLSSEQTITRKIRELILSLQLEDHYSKDEILQMYLNEAPYGGQNYGIYSASKAYFNKEPKNLTVAESAYIAGLPQSPSVYSAFGTTPETGIERKNYVLYLMKERGWVLSDGRRYHLSNDEYEKAKTEELKFETAKIPLVAPHFVFYTKQYLTDILGADMVEMGGLRIKTTLDPKVNELAQKTVFDEIEKNKVRLNLYNGAAVVIDPKTGHILAMVGSRGYNLDPEPENCVSGGGVEDGCKFDPFVNVATAKRQPGSAIKPITYATMLSKGYSAAYPFLDVKSRFPGSSPTQPYVPVNYDGQYRGPVSMRRSLANSLNIPAVKALRIVGIDSMITQAEKMGIKTFTDRSRYGLAITLGGVEARLLDLTGAYGVFANKGMFNQPTPVIEVLNARGEVIFKPNTPAARALGEDVSFIISDILSDDSSRADTFGARSLLYIPDRQVAAKTGTTDEKRDNYAVGYTPSVVVGVWVGNSNNEPMNAYVASGVSGASPIWHTIMAEYLKDKPAEKFEPPANVKKVRIDKLTGMLPYKDYETREEWLVEGTEPTGTSDWYQRLEICEIDGRIANQGCKDADETDVEEFIRIQAELPEWQTYVYDFIKSKYSGEKKYFPPQMVSQLEFDGDEVSNKDEVNVAITDQKDGDEVPLTFRMNVEVSAGNDVEQVRVYMDGKKMNDDNNEPFGYTFELSPSQVGRHEFEATATDEDGNKGSKKIFLEVRGY